MTTVRHTLVMLHMASHWDWAAGVSNRNRHVYEELQRGGQFTSIISVDFIPFSFKKVLKTFLYAKLWRSTPLTIARGLTWRVEQPDAAIKQYQVTVLSNNRLLRLLKQLGVVEADMVLWSYTPFSAPLLRQLPDSLNVFDAVDNWLEHSSYRRFQPELRRCYDLIQTDADLIFTVAEGLVDFFDKQPNVFFVPNGVDINHFATASCGINALRNDPRPVVGYVGVIQSRLNFHLLQDVIAAMPNYHFVFVGPVWRDVRDQVRTLAHADNVTVLPAVPYQQLPATLACFDVAIIPHLVDRFTSSMNPMKLYEYIAAGKAVVTTPITGSEQFGDVIQIAVSAPEFAKQIRLALRQESPELLGKRRQAIARHEWSSRVQVMLDRLNTYSVQ